MNETDTMTLLHYQTDQTDQTEQSVPLPWPAPQGATPRLPSLKSLQAFEATARLRSFSLAAAELCVSQSAVSHQVKALEQQLQQQLIDRQQQPLQLTESGASLFSVLQDCFFRMRSVCQHLSQANAGKPLSVVAQTSVAVEWLAPRLDDFAGECPAIETLLHMESAADSVDVSAFDIIIGTWPCPAGFATQSLRPEWWFPVCSPAQYTLIDPTDPASLLQFPLYSSEQGQDWQLWRQQLGLAVPAALQIRQVSLALLATKAVRAGRGFALSNPFIASDAIQRGELVALPQWRYQLPWGQYQLHYRAGSNREWQIREFVRWFNQSLGQTVAG
jgi:DNA-binding transcriptional LysR family regulator